MDKINPETGHSAEQTAAKHYVLRLYVSGVTARSVAAIENIKKICETHLQDHYDLQVIDIYQQPELASSAQIVAAPTLIKLLPQPLRHLVGDLSEKEKVLVGLDLIPAPAPSPD
ncbi:MAG: circadian clock KaiB family protein [Methylomonas sp.]